MQNYMSEKSKIQFLIAFIINVRKKSTSPHGLFKVVFANVHFVLVLSKICGRKMQFFAGSHNSIADKSIFGHFEFSFLTHKIFPGQGWFFPVSTLKKDSFNKLMIFLAGLNKSHSVSRKSTDFGHF